MISYFFRKLRKNERGATAVEFAIIAYLFFLLMFGIIEFGWILNGYVTLTSAAQEGARMAIVMNSNDVDEEAIINRVRSTARIFNLSPNKDEDIIITVRPVGEETEVEINGELDLLIAFPPFPQSINLSTTATMRQEQ